jgi:hypothetical protein
MKNTQWDYANKIEDSLEVDNFIDQLEKLFDDFIKTRKHPEKELRSEANVLSLIRCFFKRREREILELRKKTVLCNSDCITLSIMACLLAKRKWYSVRIAHPKALHRSFHTLLIQTDDTMFQIAGRYRKYVIEILEPEQVVGMLKFIKPIFDLAGKARIKLELSR